MNLSEARLLLEDKESKLRWLRARPDLQRDWWKDVFEYLEQQPERVSPIFDWIIREFKRSRLTMQPRNPHDTRLWAEQILFDMDDPRVGRKGPLVQSYELAHIADWQRAKRINIMQYTYPQVMAEVEEWDKELRQQEIDSKKYEERNVVYDYGDGWTMQQVRTKNDLEVEGIKMGHCVGGYCQQVSMGTSIIYSLRDPKNNPHVTIETYPDYQPHTQKPPFAEGVTQVQGKEDHEPIHEYAERVVTFFKANPRFYAAPNFYSSMTYGLKMYNYRPGRVVDVATTLNDIAFEYLGRERGRVVGGVVFENNLDRYVRVIKAFKLNEFPEFVRLFYQFEEAAYQDTQNHMDRTHGYKNNTSKLAFVYHAFLEACDAEGVKLPPPKVQVPRDSWDAVS